MRQPETGPFTLAVGQSRSFPTGKSNYLYCFTQQGLVEVTLRKDRKDLESHLMERFTTLNEKDFDEIVVKNRHNSQNAVRLFFGAGRYDASNDKATVNIETIATGSVDVANEPTVNVNSSTPVNVSVQNQPTVEIEDTNPVRVELVTGTVTLNQANISNGGIDAPDAEIAAGTTVQVVTANGNNVRVRITNLLDNEAVMRIGTHNQVDAETGSPLGPGETWVSETAAGVWVHNPSLAAEKVAIEVETRT